MTPLVEEIVPAPDPADCCAALEGLPYRLFLDSARTASRFGRYSFVTADPVAVVRSRGVDTECFDRTTGMSRTIRGDGLVALRELVAPHTAEPLPGLPPFQGGAAGYVAYDWVLAWDHESSRAWLISTGIPELAPAARRARAASRADSVRRHIGGTRPSDLDPRTLGPAPSHPRTFAPSHPRTFAPSHLIDPVWWPRSLQLRSSFTRTEYLAAVEKVREYIFAGDIFQANLSQRFEAVTGESAWSFYTRLRRRNAAPFAAFLDFPEVVVVSASPERFLHVDARGHVETRPIKGTRPRGFGPEHDAALGQALAESAKDRAENLMIVDLMRNDLSRVCAPGSVRVSELFSLEHYATVHHLVSTVVGDLSSGTDAIDVLRAAFPGGSITGAPKLRAMEIIAELEPSRRGVYCGSIGYWSVTGELDTNIAIRTAVLQDGRIYFSAGGGIVADSNPEHEYLETLDKARAMIDALAERR